jgi:hypothetical protein
MRSLDHYVDVTALAAFDALVHVPQISPWTSATTSIVLQD